MSARNDNSSQRISRIPRIFLAQLASSAGCTLRQAHRTFRAIVMPLRLNGSADFILFSLFRWSMHLIQSTFGSAWNQTSWKLDRSSQIVPTLALYCHPQINPKHIQSPQLALSPLPKDGLQPLRQAASDLDESVREPLLHLLHCIEKRSPFVGSPSIFQADRLERFYQQLESLLANVPVAQASQLANEASKSAIHCMHFALQYSQVPLQEDDEQARVLRALDVARRQIVLTTIEEYAQGDLQAYANYFGEVGSLLGIPGAEDAGEKMFFGAAQSELLPRIFAAYTPECIEQIIERTTGSQVPRSWGESHGLLLAPPPARNSSFAKFFLANLYATLIDNPLFWGVVSLVVVYYFILGLALTSSIMSFILSQYLLPVLASATPPLAMHAIGIFKAILVYLVAYRVHAFAACWLSVQALRRVSSSWVRQKADRVDLKEVAKFFLFKNNTFFFALENSIPLFKRTYCLLREVTGYSARCMLRTV